MNLKKSILYIFAVNIIFLRPAWAYIDPATGVMVISAIVGAFVSGCVFLKIYIDKIKKWVRKIIGNSKQNK